ncbi:MAG TPA: P-loop NTPase fold protein, partial [Pyrinomonadaceae bacterium]|nr:P-loop NTPase fold protein [Pyrinomonadaceae bacterium]
MAEPAANDSPQIVISYHGDDEKWRNRIVTFLDLAAEKFGVFDDRTDAGDTPSLEVVRVIQKAKVLLLLISPKYMKSWTRTRGLWLGLELTRKELTALGVIVQEVPMKDFDILRSYRLSQINMTPIADAGLEAQISVLSRLKSEIIDILERDVGAARALGSIDDLSRFSKSNEVENALHRARKLATSTTIRPRAVTAPALLFGLAEGGRSTGLDYFRTPQFVWKELTAGGEDVYTKVLIEEFPDLVNLGERAGRHIDSIPGGAEFITPVVLTVFDLAQEIARRTVPNETFKDQEAITRGPARPQIGARHLLAALLVLDGEEGTTVGRCLAAIVKDVPALRKRFYNFIVTSLPNDNHAAWRPILINLKVPEIQPIPDQQTVPELTQPSVAGFMADDWSGNDLLGITRDVNALASLAAAYSVEPPLSIGLFGDWGSGKSHFMRQMRKRVEMLSKHARESGKPQNELGYYKNIVQIEFNAWHYIEGNLWASLVDHIFANLKLSEKEPPKYAEQRRDELMQKLGLKEELKKKIDAQVEECEAELRKVDERKQQAEAELNKASNQLEDFRHEAIASLETLTVAVDLTAEEKELLGRLGIDADGVINGAEVR